LADNGEVVLPEGMQEITIALSVERVVGGAVEPGSSVGVVYTSNRMDPESSTQTTETQFMFHRMLVTRVVPGTTVIQGDTDSEPAEVDAFMITLAATTAQVEQLAYGAEQQLDGNGGIWLTLEPENTDQSGSTRRTGENVYG
jgi:Flp pilus assembly protein CpaB